MKKIVLLLFIIPFFTACTHNAVTGRNQLSLVSESDVQSMAVTQYQSFLSTSKVVSATTSRDAEMVRRVGSRIAAAITDYYTKQGKGDILNGYKWEFNLVANNAVNAWCMPGGKVVVYTGLLPVTQNEAALAVVLGHEITHAVARHGNERMSQQMIVQGFGSLVNMATANDPKVNSIFNTVYGPGSQVGYSLPNSRKQEYEADHYGLIFCAMAGYNPREAITFWQRMMAAGSGSAKPPALLSDHPADADRIVQLEGYMNEALTYYRPISK